MSHGRSTKKDTSQFMESAETSWPPQLLLLQAGVRLGWPRPKKEKSQPAAFTARSLLSFQNTTIRERGRSHGATEAMMEVVRTTVTTTEQLEGRW